MAQLSGLPLYLHWCYRNVGDLSLWYIISLWDWPPFVKEMVFCDHLFFTVIFFSKLFLFLVFFPAIFSAETRKTKNISENEFGDKVGRIHLGRQDLSSMKVRCGACMQGWGYSLVSWRPRGSFQGSCLVIINTCG